MKQDKFTSKALLYSFVLIALNVLLLMAFPVISAKGAGIWRALFLISTIVAYAFAYLIPAFIPLLIAVFVSKARKALCVASTAIATVSMLVLMLDAILVMRFGFHINGLVINLLMTPGGFASMGLDAATLAPAIIGLLAFIAIQIGIALLCLRTERFTVRRSAGIAVYALIVVCFLFSLFSTGFADFYVSTDLLANSDVLPFILTMRMRKFLKNCGLKEPPHEASVSLGSGKNSKLNYPGTEIKRNPERRKYNIVWLVGESMRADLLSQEIMPNTWRLSETGARLQRHYSGGNGTRTAMFSLFYGLYGINWNAFLNAKREPVFFDWLIEDGYQFLCQTSSDFTYPEFDKTIFSAIEAKDMVRQTGKIVWKRDEALVDNMLKFIAERDKSRPFFTFGFFESPHAPYSFPDDCIVRNDFFGKINYTTVSKEDAPKIYNRYANAAHYFDRQLARIYKALEEDAELCQNTIVVVTGDHGEEFFEKGRLGHNSAFTEEQIRPMCVLKIPGVEPKIIEFMTQHTDIVPTLAPFLGVTNPPEDFCIGQNIFAESYSRDHFLVCGWEVAAFVSADYKCKLPIGIKGGFFKHDMTDGNDVPLPPEESATFFSTHSKQIMKVQQDISKFVR